MKYFYILLFVSFTTIAYSNEHSTISKSIAISETGEDSLNYEKGEQLFYDTSAIYTQDWKVNITFSYDDKEYTASERIFLIDSIHSWAFPIDKKTTSGFGKRHGSFHKGIDIPLKTGEGVVAAFDGKIRYAKYNSGGFGNLVIIRHINGLETYYAHLSKIKVKPNQIVKAGELIGLGGSTGRSYSPHLHFETRFRDKAFNPANIFDTEEFCLKRNDAMIGELIQKRNYTPSQKSNAAILAEGTIYSIRSGDTLSKIANRNGTTVNKLCALNGMDQNTILQIGQKIRVN